jgi:hypothetical protein
MIAARTGQTAVVRVATSLVWLWRACKGWASQVAATFATVVALIWGGFGDARWSAGAWFFWAAVILGFLALVFQIALQRPTYMELSRREEKAGQESAEKSKAIERSLTVLIRFLAHHCGLAGNGDRVSVYYHHDKQFVMLARWSQNPTFNSPGRGTYPVGQGAIGDAWDASSVVAELPGSRVRWNQSLEKNHGFPPGTAETLKMHSQSIAAQRIATNGDAAGVIVFESTVKQRASRETLDALVDSKLYGALCELVATVAMLTPQVQEAARDDAQSAASPNVWREV